MMHLRIFIGTIMSNMEAWRAYPDIIDVPVKMNQPNEQIAIHTGPFELSQNNKTVGLEGTISFGWFPHIGVKLSGKVISGNPLMWDDRAAKVQLVVNSLIVGNAYLTHISHGDEIELEGNLIDSVVLGDKSITVSKIHFGILNLRYFYGEPVKRVNGTKVQTSRSRLTFENGNFVINLDKIEEFDSKHRTLTIAGGYLILYGGTIESKKGTIAFSDLHELLISFSHFLTFLNGRRCCPVILKGMHNDEVIWTDYSGYICEQFKSVPTWPCHMRVEGLGELWSKWSEIAKDELDFDFLKTAVHWYAEANSNAALVEGSLILAQTALELIYNWLVVEQKGILMGPDATNISAANKIRVLLNQLDANFEIPSSLQHLTAYKNSVTEILDGPECFVRIRNAIVHANEDKRKTLAKIPNMARYEALQLGIWYIELSMLKILGFEGSYSNRCKGGGWAGEHEEPVPWRAKLVS
ncbi:hypothetical protein [Chryseolinea sp. H1M3-3]|uniref:hypothetical protein n=1 Tax=Chryseolinea sp. H1M3-3 TaxID=3034144 RepID=UPI0023EB63A8|nr:hypothetical protein [Chryseolinea sp. H1M3-3]